jgi:hypothetical protein
MIEWSGTSSSRQSALDTGSDSFEDHARRKKELKSLNELYDSICQRFDH